MRKSCPCQVFRAISVAIGSISLSIHVNIQKVERQRERERERDRVHRIYECLMPGKLKHVLLGVLQT